VSEVSASPFDDAYEDFDREEENRDEETTAREVKGRGKRRAPACSRALERDRSSLSGKLRFKSGDHFGKLKGQLTLYMIDAVSGEGVRGADVSFQGAVGQTDEAGRVCFEHPKGDLMRETLKARFERQGYASADLELRFMAGTLFFNRFTVTKALPPGKLRVVLDWDAQPRDLDAHLVREGAYHISYREMRSYQDLAELDRDDLDGFGPETVTIQRLNTQADYRFFVRDFTRSGRLNESKARVTVYTERGLLKTFYVPSDLKGDTWQVFSLHEGQLR
jgi:hypothetical protein